METFFKEPILLTGVSGYVGGRLKQSFEDQGLNINCLVRSFSQVPEKHPSTTKYIVTDILDKKGLTKALTGIHTAYYLIHSMGAHRGFAEIDRELAAQFALTASKCGVKRIIYLGGLGSHYDTLSPHLQSRHEVGSVLRGNTENTQVIEFRSSIVIGSGSLSFEMIRKLVERLPVMITPSWVRTYSQPIGIQDLLAYLSKALTIKIEGDPIFEIGGRDKVTYADIMQEYAKEIGVKRYMIPVPILSPRLSSLWLGLITPVYARVGRKLVESACCSTVVHDPLAAHLFNIHPMGVREAISQAIRNENHAYPATRWNDSISSATAMKDWSKSAFGGRLIDFREAIVNATLEEAFLPIRTIGGEKGYYSGNIFWKLRGIFDLIVGGVGMRRGRRDPYEIKPGDVIDFWRVESYQNNYFLKLYAEMKLPGRAWLEFRVHKEENGTKVTQKAIFDPIGVRGILYWYLMYPFHSWIFRRMFKGILKSIKKGGK